MSSLESEVQKGSRVGELTVTQAPQPPPRSVLSSIQGLSVIPQEQSEYCSNAGSGFSPCPSAQPFHARMSSCPPFACQTIIFCPYSATLTLSSFLPGPIISNSLLLLLMETLLYEMIFLEHCLKDIASYPLIRAGRWIQVGKWEEPCWCAPLRRSVRWCPVSVGESSAIAGDVCPGRDGGHVRKEISSSAPKYKMYHGITPNLQRVAYLCDILFLECTEWVLALCQSPALRSDWGTTVQNLILYLL